MGAPPRLRKRRRGATSLRTTARGGNPLRGQDILSPRLRPRHPVPAPCGGREAHARSARCGRRARSPPCSARPSSPPRGLPLLLPGRLPPRSVPRRWVPLWPALAASRAQSRLDRRRRTLGRDRRARRCPARSRRPRDTRSGIRKGVGRNRDDSRFRRRRRDRPRARGTRSPRIGAGKCEPSRERGSRQSRADEPGRAAAARGGAQVARRGAARTASTRAPRGRRASPSQSCGLASRARVRASPPASKAAMHRRLHRLEELAAR